MLEEFQRKIVTLPDLSEIRVRHPHQKIAHCHGVFDVLHAGHLSYFQSAKSFGEILVVTVTADSFVNKGPGRPYFTSKVRASMLAALELVDYVAVSPHPTAVPVLEALKPHFYVKGPDYRDKTSDPTGEIYNEERAAKNGGGELVFTSDETFSSSTLINSFFNTWNEDQLRAIEDVKRAGGLHAIEEALARVSRESVVIVGEPIVDQYVFCRPESISSKSPCLSAKYLYDESYLGGSIAIANHLADFASQVSLVTTHGGEPYFEALLGEKLDPRIRFESQVLAGVPTPRKTRYIADDKVQRLFELTDLKSDQWNHHPSDKFISKMDATVAQASVLIVADFGHGLVERDVLEKVSKYPVFRAVNVQTNSSNFGFNPFTKHAKFDYLAIDLKEARVAFQDRHSDHLSLLTRVKKERSQVLSAVSMTLGPHGAYFYPSQAEEPHLIPAFAGSVLDAVGAGDAYFAITSLLAKIGTAPLLIPFVGNVFAGLKARIMGNKASVSKGQLIKAVTSILK